MSEIKDLAWCRVYPDLQGAVGCNSEIRKGLGLGNKRPGPGGALFQSAKKAFAPDPESPEKPKER